AKAERILSGQGMAEEQFALSTDRAKALIGIGHYGEAERVLNDMGSQVPVAEFYADRSILTQLRYELALADHDWHEALMLLQNLKQQSDSLHRSQVDLKMAGLQVMYQVDRKEKDNTALRDINARNEATIVEQRTSNRYLIALGAGLLMLAVALFLTSRFSMRMVRRSRLKSEVIRRQHDEIHAKNMELQRQNMRLAETLMSEEEKEIMIREIHHRVKNNLQVVDSLLAIQCGSSDDPRLERMLREAQGRIRSMALVHEHIYRSVGMAHASLKTHLEQLARNALVAHGQHDRISVMVEATEIALPVEMLMPLSLVVNELLTNAVKYAFDGKDRGHVRIIVRPAGNGHELLFSDDGIGLDKEQPFLRERSFGLELVQVLAQQLNGEVRVLKGAGATFSMTFFPDRVALRRAS
ncbi:MAG TPA: sensor histidine kinase, partial [Flavobacteriales bacterium]|nr:sensor histidine kinase [Flavobacteriales bacterium]